MKKRTVVKLLTYSLAAFAVACGFAAKYRNETMAYRRAEIYNGYMSMTALADAAEDMSRAFSEGVYAYSPQVIASLSNNIWRSSANAVEALSHLPVYDAEIENTRSFISRAGDYASYLSRTAANGALSETDRAMLGEMAKASAQLSDSIRSMENDIYAGNVMFSGTVYSSDGAVLRFNDIEKAGAYPSPEYDGVMSEAYMLREPAMFENADDCDMEKAARAAAAALGCAPEELEYQGESGGRINCHVFALGEDEAYICCKGGMAVTLRRQGYNTAEETAAMTRSQPEYDSERLLEIAADELRKLGYPDMSALDSTATNDGINAHFVCAENGVRCYPDTVYVEYSPEQGITALDASGYITNHRIRGVNAHSTDDDRKKDRLPSDITMEYVETAVITNDYGSEDICRVYKGMTEDGRELRIYCGAADGEQRKIEIR